MGRYIAKRLLSGILLLITVSILAFALLYFMPGSAVDYLVDENASAETVARITAQYGLDQPLHIQYLRWLEKLLHGDLGQSLQSKVPVSEIIGFRLPITLQFTLWAFLLRLVISIPLGIVCALRKDGALDRIVMALTSMFQAIPNFWLGILLILLFSVGLGWLPLNGYGTPAHYILPTIALAMSGVANSIRLTKVEALDVIRERYVLTAYAKGLPRRRVIVRHVLRNSLILVMVMSFMSIPYLISGAMIIENLFVIPGMGTIITQSIKVMDFPVVQAAVLLIAALVIVCNIASDILTAILDPRVREEMK